jgi:hypothetical protein
MPSLQIATLAQHPQNLERKPPTLPVRVMSKWRPSADSHCTCYVDRSLEIKLVLQSPTYVQVWKYLAVVYTHAALVQSQPYSIHISATTNYQNHHSLASTSHNDDRSASSKEGSAQRDQIATLVAQQERDRHAIGTSTESCPQLGPIQAGKIAKHLPLHVCS